MSRRAIELDPDDPFALAVAGHILSFMGRSPEEALDLFEQALAINQNSPFAWGLSALTLAYLGRPDEALERLQNVWRLNPFDPLELLFWIVAGLRNSSLADTHEAIVWLRKRRRANPRFRRLLTNAGRRACPVQATKLEPNWRLDSFSKLNLRFESRLSFPGIRCADQMIWIVSLRALRAAGLPE